MNRDDIDAVASGITERWVALRRSQGATATSGLSRSLGNLQHPFLSRLDSLIQEIYGYEDRELLDMAMDLIPIGEIFEKAEHMSSDYPTLSVDDLVAMELAKWFKSSFMKWVDVVPCDKCPDGGKTHSIPNSLVTNEERLDGAGRVEMSECEICGTISRFPRFGSVRKLLATRRGRCGEWAAVFALMLRAIGHRMRYVWNSEDHVWNEVYSEHLKRWVHIDSCEAAFDKPSIYELGWGKKMRYCIAISTDGIKDVTRRYVTGQERALPRDSINEVSLTLWIAMRTAQMRQGLDQQRLADEDVAEEMELSNAKNRSVQTAELQGRQSGSLEWRSSRQETGEEILLEDGEIIFDLTEKFDAVYLNGKTRKIGKGLLLTDATPDQTSSAFFTQPVSLSDALIITFSFRLSRSPGSEDGADGFAFVLHMDPAGFKALGEGGCGLGYSGLENAIAIEFDTYQTWDRCQEPPAPHVALHRPESGQNKVSSHHRQATAMAGIDSVPPLNDGRVYYSRIQYANKMISVFLDEGIPGQKRNWSLILKANVDLASIGSHGYVGFTAATGGISQRHELIEWTIARPK